MAVIFQQIMDMLLTRLNFKMVYLDDILIGETIEEHYILLEKVFRRIQEFSFILRIEKYKFLMTSMKYMDQIIDHQEWQPDQ